MNWTSPAVLRGPTRPRTWCCSIANAITAHNPHSGEQVWSYDVACSSIPSPVAEGDTDLCSSAGLDRAADQPAGENGRSRCGAQRRCSPATPAPSWITAGCTRSTAPACCLCGDAATGEGIWKLRLKGQFWATPVVAGEHMYIFNQDGLAQVVQLGDKSGEIVSRGEFGERVFGTPVIADGAFYVRTDATYGRSQVH